MYRTLVLFFALWPSVGLAGYHVWVKNTSVAPVVLFVDNKPYCMVANVNSDDHMCVPNLADGPHFLVALNDYGRSFGTIVNGEAQIHIWDSAFHDPDTRKLPEAPPANLDLQALCLSGPAEGDMRILICKAAVMTTTAPATRARLRHQVISGLLAKKEFPDALWHADVAIRENEADWLNYTWRCAVREEWGRDLQFALGDCTEAVRLDPNPIAVFKRGLIHMKLGNWRDAIADFEPLLAKSPDSKDLHYLRGLAKLRLGRAEGKTEMDAAVGAQPALAERYKDIPDGSP